MPGCDKLPARQVLAQMEGVPAAKQPGYFDAEHARGSNRKAIHGKRQRIYPINADNSFSLPTEEKAEAQDHQG